MTQVMGQKISEMSEGEGFGEKALTEKSGKRSATILAITNCECIIISKDDYINIVRKYDKRTQRKESFMRKCLPCLDNVASSVIIEDLYFLLKEHEWNQGRQITKEGDFASHVYFLYEGVCEVQKTLTIELGKTQEGRVERMTCKKVIGTIGPGTAIGEEAAIEPFKYLYDIIVKLKEFFQKLDYNEKCSYLLGGSKFI